MAREHQCKTCDRTFTSMMRLQHHRAAEHAPKTVKDICTRKKLRTNQDIPHRPVTRS
jgi:hypothetical protein